MVLHFQFLNSTSKLPHFSFLRQAIHSIPSNVASNSTTLSDLLQGHILRGHLLQIHACVFRLDLHQDNLIATRLIGHYPSKYGLRIFHCLKNPNIFPFNAIIRVLAEENLCSKAFSIFKTLLKSISPNDLTFSFLLKASCGSSSDINYVKQIHTRVLKTGMVDRNVYVCNGLLNVYAKGFKDMVSARKLFDETPERGMISCWTSLISGYAHIGQCNCALELFLSMLKEGLRPENDTLVSVLSACSTLEIVHIEKWVDLFSDFLKSCGSTNNFACDLVNIVLVYLFGKLGKVENSRERFDKISDIGRRSVLSWNAIIGAYVQNGCALEGLSIFRLMMEDEANCSPNHVTMVSVLSACSQVGDLDLGVWVHEYLKSKGRRGVLVSNRNLGTALIDMYSKCGNLEKAREVFDQMVNKDVVSFNAMIMGLAVNGEAEKALWLFREMQEIGMYPNGETFLGILCACSHSGLLEEGRQMFRDMKENLSVTPRLEHYACYIDLLARVGCLEEALEVLNSMPYEPNNFVWGSLLGGCVLHNRLELAKTISTMLVKVDPGNSAGYVMLSNAFATGSRWVDVSGTRCFMKEKGVSKQRGCSWISICGTVHEFAAGSLSHIQNANMHCTLHKLLEEMKLASF